MQDRFFRFGGFNQGNSSEISGFGGGQQVARVIRRVYVSNDSPTQLSTLNPFLTPLFQPMFPTMDMTSRRFYHVDDSPPSPPSKPETSMITHHRYYSDGFPSPFPSIVEPPEETRRYYPDEYYTPPPKANPPMISEGYYGNEFSNYQPRHDPPGGIPINLNVNLHLRPQDLQAPYPANGNYNSQTGGGQYNPQVQGGNKVGGNGKVTLGPDINGGNVNIGGGKAGGGNVGGGKKKDEDDDSSDDE